MAYSMKVGYHGTHVSNVNSIRDNNFRVSNREDNARYGKGVYFFIDGLGNPMHHAQDWNSFLADKAKKPITDYAVLSVNVRIDDDCLLDLTKEEFLKVFAQTKRAFVEKINSKLARSEVNQEVILASDYSVIEFIKEKYSFSILKANIVATAGLIARYSVSSFIPNATILAVNKPDKHIEIQSLNVCSKQI